MRGRIKGGWDRELKRRKGWGRGRKEVSGKTKR